MVALILLGVFVATIVVVIGGYVFLNRRRLDAAHRARERLTDAPESSTRTRSLLRDDSVSHLPLLNRLLAGRSIAEELADQLRHAGSTLTPGAFLLSVLLGAMLGLAISVAVARSPAIPVLVAVGAVAPFAWLRWRQRGRRQAFEAQLPEAMDMLVSAMRAGYSFQAAMNFVSQELSGPLGPEFARFYEEQRLGIDVRTALLRLQERVNSLDLRMFVTAVLIQRETGGNLAEILTNLSDLMRDRISVRGQVETLTAEPKLSAKILAALPVLVFFVLWILDPDFVRPMLTSDAGRMLLFISAVSVVLGYAIMLRIADVDF